MYIYEETITVTVDRNGRRTKQVKHRYVDDRTGMYVPQRERDTRKYSDTTFGSSFGKINEAYRDYLHTKEW